jgi:tRNA1(Val) A37 N6-methylase TrmN6
MASTDLSKITERQQKIWSAGDFHRIGVAQVVVGEMLVRSLDVHAGESVLDVAGGAGNAALMWSVPITFPSCCTARSGALKPKGCRCASGSPMPSSCPSMTAHSTW